MLFSSLQSQCTTTVVWLYVSPSTHHALARRMTVPSRAFKLYCSTDTMYCPTRVCCCRCYFCCFSVLQADKKRKCVKKDAPNHGEAAMLSNAGKAGRKPFKPPRIGKAAATDQTAAAAAAVPCSGLSTRGRKCKASQKAAAGAECGALLDDYELAGTSCSSRSDSEVEDNGDTDSDA